MKTLGIIASILFLILKVVVFFGKKNNKEKEELNSELQQIWKEKDEKARIDRLNSIIQRI